MGAKAKLLVVNVGRMWLTLVFTGVWDYRSLKIRGIADGSGDAIDCSTVYERD